MKTEYVLKALDLLTLCLRLKKEKNIDVFFDYSPHIQLVTIRVYTPNWVSDQNPTKKFSVMLGEELKEYYESIDEVESYLLNLLQTHNG